MTRICERLTKPVPVTVKFVVPEPAADVFGATPETVGAGVGVTVKGMSLLSAVEPTLRTVKVTVPAVVGVEGGGQLARTDHGCRECRAARFDFGVGVEARAGDGDAQRRAARDGCVRRERRDARGPEPPPSTSGG